MSIRNLPQNWVETKVNEITLPVSKINKNENIEKKIQYIDIGSIDNEQNRVTEGKSYILSEAPSRAKQIICSGDVLFATVRPYLRNIASVPRAFDGEIASTGFAVLRPARGICPNYLYYLCISNSFVDALSGIQYGVSYPAVKSEQVFEQDFPLPPLNEQKRIVAKIEELFSELDKGIESLKFAREQLKVYRQAVLKHAFEGKLTAKWRVENGVFQGWTNVPLQSVIDVPKYGTSKKCEYGTPGVGVLRIPNIVSGVVDSKDMKFAQFDDDEIEKYALRQGDILTIRSNGSISIVGKCALIRAQDEGFLYAGYLIRIRPIVSQVLPEFLAYLLSSHALRIQIEHKAKSTSGVNNINAKEIQDLIISVCDIREQEEVVKTLQQRMSLIDKSEQVIDIELQKAEDLRQSILKNAFSGQLVPQDPTDESASLLLKCIRAEKEAVQPSFKKTKLKKKENV